MGRRANAKALDLSQEALRLVRSGREAGLEIRILGSAAVVARCEDARDLLRRHDATPKDIDLAALGHQRRRVSDFLYGQGFVTPQGEITPYMDRDVFSLKRGAREIHVEVFFDELRLVHRISFRDDFGRSFPTLSLETLIMSKLQIRRRTFVDWLHLAALLVQSTADEQKERYFLPARIRNQTEKDYRCWRDFLAALEELLSPEILSSLKLTADELSAMTAGAERVKASIAASRHGPLWLVGRLKAQLGIEPPEPEAAEYWE